MRDRNMRDREIDTEIERQKQRSRDRNRESADELHVSDSSSWSFWYGKLNKTDSEKA